MTLYLKCHSISKTLQSLLLMILLHSICLQLLVKDVTGLDLFNTPLSGTTTGLCVGGVKKRSFPPLFQNRGAICMEEKADRFLW